MPKELEIIKKKKVKNGKNKTLKPRKTRTGRSH